MEKPGKQLDMQSARVGTILIGIKDAHGEECFLCHTHGYSPQQSCAEQERDEHMSQLEKGLALAKKKDIFVLAMDTNCSFHRSEGCG